MIKGGDIKIETRKMESIKWENYVHNKIKR